MEGPYVALSQTPRVLSVGEVTGRLRAHVERAFADVWVEGEVSNLRTPASGHCYFTLKDEAAQLRAVMWRSAVRTLPFSLRDGLRVRARGSASVYEPRGDLQLLVRSVQSAGAGALQQAFEELKQRLAAEGLFDAQRKRRLPAFPNRLAVVTSGDGAALQDVLSILRRRYPLVEVQVHAVRVQGLGAAEEIVRALDAISGAPVVDQPDLVIVGRGGGSLEDLWAFNEEIVARAIYRCRVPVVSAVGHETDFSIADFVADVRAATPSMAAELVAPDRKDVVRRIYAFEERLVALHRVRLERLRRHILHITRSHSFNRPVDRIHLYQQRLDDLHDRLNRCMGANLARMRAQHATTSAKLALLDPRLPLQRGYALVEKGTVRVRTSETLQVSDKVTLQFVDGARRARVEE